MTEEPLPVDMIDQAIIGLLSEHGRMTWRELGDEVALGATSVAERVRRLEQRGVISGYRAVIDPAALGIGLRAMIDAKLDREASVEAFEAHLAESPLVQLAAHVTGEFDYVVTVACPDVAALDELLTGWRTNFGVAQTSTRLMLRDVN
jgi:Lrp/AsnC family leucine-responsive transcriptional regulator